MSHARKAHRTCFLRDCEVPRRAVRAFALRRSQVETMLWHRAGLFSAARVAGHISTFTAGRCLPCHHPSSCEFACCSLMQHAVACKGAPAAANLAAAPHSASPAAASAPGDMCFPGGGTCASGGGAAAISHGRACACCRGVRAAADNTATSALRVSSGCRAPALPSRPHSCEPLWGCCRQPRPRMCLLLRCPHCRPKQCQD